jgi:adenylate isopentenyltransferase (cytokinin synthase)
MLSIKPMVIMGATGMGKTKLSIDISKVFGGEVINADEMQMYTSLDIATNKIWPNH